MNPHRDEHLELCAGYVLGNLSEAESAELEAHLKEGCGVCETEIHRLGRGAWAFAAASPRLLEPPALRAKVLEVIKEDGRDRSREGKRVKKGEVRREPARAPIPLPKRRSAAPALAWAMAIAAVVVAFIGFDQWKDAASLRTQLGAAQEEIARLNRELTSERQWSAVAVAPQTRIIPLAPTKDATAAGASTVHARVTYDPGTRRAIVSVSDLVTPSGKDYQLWAITKGGPASLGLVRADREGRAMIQVENAGDPFTLAAFAMSLENEGGAPTSTAPAGPVVLLGKIGL